MLAYYSHGGVGSFMGLIWSMKAILGLLLSVYVVSKIVKRWFRARRSLLVIVAAVLLPSSTWAVGADSCADAACDSVTQHCERYADVASGFYCAAGPEPWYSLDQSAQGSAQSQWLLGLAIGALFFIGFSTRFRP